MDEIWFLRACHHISNAVYDVDWRVRGAQLATPAHKSMNDPHIGYIHKFFKFYAFHWQ
jgi:hypothetical protein